MFFRLKEKNGNLIIPAVLFSTSFAVVERTRSRCVLNMNMRASLGLEERERRGGGGSNETSLCVSLLSLLSLVFRDYPPASQGHQCHQQWWTSRPSLLRVVSIWINKLRFLSRNQRSSTNGLVYLAIQSISSLSKNLVKQAVDGELALAAPHGHGELISSFSL